MRRRIINWFWRRIFKYHEYLHKNNWVHKGLDIFHYKNKGNYTLSIEKLEDDRYMGTVKTWSGTLENGAYSNFRLITNCDILELCEALNKIHFPNEQTNN